MHFGCSVAALQSHSLIATRQTGIGSTPKINKIWNIKKKSTWKWHSKKSRILLGQRKKHVPCSMIMSIRCMLHSISNGHITSTSMHLRYSDGARCVKVRMHALSACRSANSIASDLIDDSSSMHVYHSPSPPPVLRGGVVRCRHIDFFQSFTTFTEMFSPCQSLIARAFPIWQLLNADGGAKVAQTHREKNIKRNVLPLLQRVRPFRPSSCICEAFKPICTAHACSLPM